MPYLSSIWSLKLVRRSSLKRLMAVSSSFLVSCCTSAVTRHKAQSILISALSLTQILSNVQYTVNQPTHVHLL